MSCSDSFASARSGSASSLGSARSRSPHTFLDDFSFLLLQFLVQEGESVPNSDSHDRGTAQPSMPAVRSLQAVLQAARRSEDDDGELSSVCSSSASAELFLVRLKGLLEGRVHERQAVLLAQRLCPAVPGTSTHPSRPASPAPTTSQRRRSRFGTARDSTDSSRGSSLSRFAGAVQHAPGGALVPHSPNIDQAVAAPDLCHLHGDLLLRLQHHLCESMSRAEDRRDEHGGFAGVIFPERALVLQHELLDGVDAVLAESAEDARSHATESTTATASAGFARELAAARRQLGEARHQDGWTHLSVHELSGGPASFGDCTPDDDGDGDGERLRSRLGHDGVGFVSHAVQQHVWLLWRMLRQRFTAYSGWDLLDRAARFVTMPSKSPSPAVPSDVDLSTHNASISISSASCGAVSHTAKALPASGEEAVGTERPFTSPSLPPLACNGTDDGDSEDDRTPIRPPPIVANTQTKHRSPAASVSPSPPEELLSIERVRRVTQKPEAAQDATDASVLCTLASLQHKLPRCAVYDALMNDLRSLA